MGYQPFMPTETFLKLEVEVQEHIIKHGTELDLSECPICHCDQPTAVSAVQYFGQRAAWPENVIYVGMPGNAARAFGITDDIAGPFGKPWHLLNDPRGWAAAYTEYLALRLTYDEPFRAAVTGLHGLMLLCWCAAKAQKENREVACHARVLAEYVEMLNHEGAD